MDGTDVITHEYAEPASPIGDQSYRSGMKSTLNGTNRGDDSARKYSPICRQKFIRSGQMSPFVGGGGRSNGASSTDLFGFGQFDSLDATNKESERPRYGTRLTSGTKAGPKSHYVEENEKLKARLK